MYDTFTVSATITWTDARVRYVMDKVFEDLLSQMYAGLITRSTAEKWRDDFSYLLLNQAVERFQIQFRQPNGSEAGVEYRVVEGGHVVIDERSGGLNYFGFPGGTVAAAVVSYRSDCPHLPQVQAEMARRGWGSGGQMLAGGTVDSTYSRGGCGVERSRVGDWDI